MYKVPKNVSSIINSVNNDACSFLLSQNGNYLVSEIEMTRASLKLELNLEDDSFKIVCVP